MLQRAIWIFWPSFIVAIAAEATFFTFIDPGNLYLFDEAPQYSRTAIYSVGFFCFWLFAAVSSALTIFLQKGAAEINGCVLPPRQRATLCPHVEKTTDTR